MVQGESTGAVANTALNFIDIFNSADWVVKIVMGLLVLASLWSWAIIIDKAFKLSSLNKGADGFENTLASGKALEDIAQSLGSHPRAPFERLVVSVTSALARL